MIKIKIVINIQPINFFRIVTTDISNNFAVLSHNTIFASSEPSYRSRALRVRIFLIYVSNKGSIVFSISWEYYSLRSKISTVVSNSSSLLLIYSFRTNILHPMLLYQNVEKVPCDFPLNLKPGILPKSGKFR